MNKLIGGILLIIGTSIGGAMLALPTVISLGGYLYSTLWFLLCWLTMTLGALYLLEVNLLFPENSNLITMAKRTLGPIGALFTWIVYLLLMYTLVSAYTSGCGDILHGIVNSYITHPMWVSTLIVVCIFVAIISSGIGSIDWVNRFLMMIKLSLFVILVVTLLPQVHVRSVFEGQWNYLPQATMVIITSFGYAIIIPSLRSYFNNDIYLIRKAVYIGSLIPLLIYMVWSFIIISIVDWDQLHLISQSPHSLSLFVNVLQTYSPMPGLKTISIIFSALCVTTSLLGVSLSLIDFLLDGLQINRHNLFHKLCLIFLAFMPAYLIAVFCPRAFIIGFKYAGYWCVLLLIILPVLMALISRIRFQADAPYRVAGGKTILGLTFALALWVIFMDAWF